MARLEREQGIQIHWEERGEGPLVVLAPYSIFHPSVYDPIAAELERDHRVVRYDDRGAGQSTRTGPHDMDTGAGDLAAVIEASGGPAVIVGLGDATNRAVRVCAQRPELVEAMVIPGGMPAGRKRLEGSEAMAASDTVVNAFLSMCETDYRGALRSLVTAGNPQMSEDEIRERVRPPGRVPCPRRRRWPGCAPGWRTTRCKPRSPAATGSGCSVRRTREAAGSRRAGRPPRLSRELFPDAHVEEVEEGIISRPDLTAAVVRRVTAPLRAAPA